MEALICPECGGKVDEPAAGGNFATCEYCLTKFLVSRPEPAPAAVTVAPTAQEDPITYHDLDEPSRPTNPLALIVPGLVLIIVTIELISYFSSSSKNAKQTANAMQTSANSAQSSSNAMKELMNLANKMSNQARTNANAALENANRLRANVNRSSPSQKRPADTLK